MKISIFAVSILLLAVPAPAQASTTVTFTIDYEQYPVSGSHTCTVAISEGAVVASLLDAATATGCISGWHGTDHGSGGRFVDMIDDKRSFGQALVVYTWWAVLANGDLTANGVDFEVVDPGKHYTFEYRVGSVADWL